MSAFNAWQQVANSRLQTLPKFTSGLSHIDTARNLREKLDLSHRKGIVSFDEFMDLRDDLRKIPHLSRKTDRLESRARKQVADPEYYTEEGPITNSNEGRKEDALDAEFRTRQAERAIHNRLIASSYGRTIMFGTSWNQQWAGIVKGALSAGAALGQPITHTDREDVHQRETETYDPWAHAAAQVEEEMGHAPTFVSTPGLLQRPGALGRTIAQGGLVSAPALVAGAAAFYGAGLLGLSATAVTAIAAAAGLSVGGSIEFIMALPEALEEANVSWEKQGAVAEAFKDNDLKNQVILTALKKAAPIAAMDAASIGLLKLPTAATRAIAKPAVRHGTNFVLHTGIQAGAEGGGELLGQLWAFHRANLDDVVVEALAGGGLGVGATAIGYGLNKAEQAIFTPRRINRIEARAKAEAAAAVIDAAERTAEATKIPGKIDSILEAAESSDGKDPQQHVKDIKKLLEKFFEKDPEASHILVSAHEVARQSEGGNASLLAASGLSAKELQQHIEDGVSVPIRITEIPGNRRLGESIKEASDHVKLSHADFTIAEFNREKEYIRSRQKAVRTSDSDIRKREKDIKAISKDLEALGYNTQDSREISNLLVDVWYSVTSSTGSTERLSDLLKIIGPGRQPVGKDRQHIIETVFTSILSKPDLDRVRNTLEDENSTPDEIAKAKAKLDQYLALESKTSPELRQDIDDAKRAGFDGDFASRWILPKQKFMLVGAIYKGRFMRKLAEMKDKRKERYLKKLKGIFPGLDGDYTEWGSFIETADSDTVYNFFYNAGIYPSHGLGLGFGQSSFSLGFYTMGQGRITINPSGDVGTIIHEFAHFIHEAIKMADDDGSLDPEIRGALRSMEIRHEKDKDTSPFGKDPNYIFEIFAEEFTDYIINGRTKDPYLKVLFATMTRILARLMGIGSFNEDSISSEGRNFFDMLLAADFAARKKFHEKLPIIANAREGRAFGLTQEQVDELIANLRKQEADEFTAAAYGETRDADQEAQDAKPKVESMVDAQAVIEIDPETRLARWRNPDNIKEEFNSGEWVIVSVMNSKDDEGNVLSHPQGAARHPVNEARYQEAREELWLLYGTGNITEVKVYNGNEFSGIAFLITGKTSEDLFAETNYTTAMTFAGWVRSDGKSITEWDESSSPAQFGEGTNRSGYWFQVKNGQDFSLPDTPVENLPPITQTTEEGVEVNLEHRDPGLPVSFRPDDGGESPIDPQIEIQEEDPDNLYQLYVPEDQPKMSEAERQRRTKDQLDKLIRFGKRYVYDKTVQYIYVLYGNKAEGEGVYAIRAAVARKESEQAKALGDVKRAVELIERSLRYTMVDIYMREAAGKINKILDFYESYRYGARNLTFIRTDKSGQEKEITPKTAKEMDAASKLQDPAYATLIYKLLVWHGYLPEPDLGTSSPVGVPADKMSDYSKRFLVQKRLDEIEAIKKTNEQRQISGEELIPVPEPINTTDEYLSDDAEAKGLRNTFYGSNPLPEEEMYGGDYMNPMTDVRALQQRNVPLNTSLLPRIPLGATPAGSGRIIPYTPNVKPGLYKDFLNLAEFVRQLDFMRRQTKLETRLALKAESKALRESIAMEAKEESQPTTKMWEAVRNALYYTSSWMRIPEHLFFAMDGFQFNGPVWRAVFKPLSDAQNDNNVMLAEYGAKVKEILKDMKQTPFWKRVRGKKILIGGRMTSPEEVFMIAVNSGTASGKKTLLNGSRAREGFTEDYHAAVMELVTEQEWKVIIRIWELMNELEVEHNKVQMRVFGAAQPEWDTTRMSYVDSRGHTIEFLGRPFPIVTDPGHVNPLTANGFEKLRGWWNIHNDTKDHAGAPEKVNLGIEDGLLRAIQAKIHGITHTEAKAKVGKLFDYEYGIRQSIINRYSVHHMNMLDDWLAKVTGVPHEPMDPLSLGFNAIRTTAATAIMALNLRSATQQLLGYFSASELIGRDTVFRGAKIFMGSPREQWMIMKEMSPYMKARGETAHRDLADKLAILRRPGKDRWTKLAWWQTRMSDMIMSTIVWWGQYDKAISEGKSQEDSVEEADSAVRMSQASGRQSDLAPVSSGNEFTKLMTMFIGPLVAIHNLHANVFLRNKPKGWTKKQHWDYYTSTLMYLFVFPSAAVATFFNEPEEKEDEWKHYLNTTLQSFVDPFPVARDLSTAFGGRGTGISPVPFDYATDAVRNLLAVYEDGVEDDLSLETIYLLIETWFYAVGGPAVSGGRLKRAIEGYNENDYTGREAIGQALGTRGVSRIPEFPEKISDFVDDIGF